MTWKVLVCGKTVSSLALLSIIVSSPGWGQTITSTIVGQVNDPSGAGVPDARVTAKNAETGIATEGASDSSGTYTIPQIQPGILRHHRHQKWFRDGGSDCHPRVEFPDRASGHKARAGRHAADCVSVG